MINYRDTLNLPSTEFPMRANLIKREPIILESWNKDNLYEMIRYKKNQKKRFFLHDGPLYGNGNIHLGHAVNRILKDIILKFKGLMGYDAPYVPGWDCHGLPIELQVERLIGQFRIKNFNPQEFRKICRNYVLKQIDAQKKDLMRLGILGNWKFPYLTMDFKTEANIVRTLRKIIFDGYFYKGTKPIHWCFQCRSALAESEIEYNIDHSSYAIDIIFPAVDEMNLIKKFNINLPIKIDSVVVSLLVWTTTPWTLPANQAIAVHPDYKYQLIKINDKDNKRCLIIVADLVNVVMKRIRCSNWHILGEVLGVDLESFRFYHPFLSFDVPVVLSDHVKLDCGTGIVHIAPNYGTDDFCIAQKYALKRIVDLIDDRGFYISNIHPKLDRVQIFKANEIIVNLLRQHKNLLFLDNNYRHNYPYCWRHMVPVVLRITEQWFLSMDRNNLRSRLLKMISKIRWIPDKGYSNIKMMIINRPDWCISRQRSWGVPIPLLVHKKNGSLHPRTFELMEIVAKSIEKYGVEAWWDLKIEELITDEDEIIQYKKVSDVLDVWFDSGSTNYSVIPERSEYLGKLPDMYLEGVDQYRGWFMSSLIVSGMIRNKAPYKEVLTHGFTVDARGYKMSKSVGNVINPQEIIDKFGADILRLWVALSDYSKDITISDDILKHISEVYRRIRNTARFCLANINDFHPNKDIVFPKNIIALDRWAIERTLCTQLKIISDYKKYNFHYVIQHIMHFCSVEMGSFYLDVIKDRQYTTKKDGLARRSCQTTLYHIIEAMVRWIAPILSFTADEIWRCIPGNRSKYVFTEEWYDGLFKIDKEQIMNDDYWNIFLDVRNEVNKVIEKARVDKIIGGSLEASIILYVTSELEKKLCMLKNELSFGLMTSSAIVVHIDNISADVVYTQSNIPGLKIVLKKVNEKKCLRCWHYRLDVGKDKKYPDICKRCIENIAGVGEERRFI